MPPEKFESHPQAPHAIARCSACRKRRCAARIRLSRAGRAWHRAQQIANRRADRKKTGILAYKAHDLQAERQPLGRQYRQRQGRNQGCLALTGTFDYF
jgi:hypothetical protein